MLTCHKTILSIVLTSLCIFASCSEKKPKVQEYNKNYILDECKDELLNADDYRESGSIDFIMVEKKERNMYLYKNHKIESVIPISLGKNPIGAKLQQGDHKTPEGVFWISRKLCSPKYYRSLCISYPLISDIKQAKANGINPGGDITIHAQPKWNANGQSDKYTLSRNWTQGCVAVTNSAMDQLWYAVREGVPIIIK